MKLGDAVKKITDAAGIPQCGGCKRRQEALNRADDEVRKRVREKLRGRKHR